MLHRAKPVVGTFVSKPAQVALVKSFTDKGAMASPEIDALTNALARLPGLGPWSSRRAVCQIGFVRLRISPSW